MMYIRTKDGIHSVEAVPLSNGRIRYSLSNEDSLISKEDFEKITIREADTIEELCDEFVFNSDISNYVIDKKFIEHTKAIILKIYKENDETDYVKAMHPKFYGAIWVDGKGLIYVAKMNDKGELELI